MTREEILKKQQEVYSRLFVALSMVPKEIEISDNWDVYNSGIFLFTNEIKEAKYHELCKHLIEWELDHYNYKSEVYNNTKLHKILVCHSLRLDNVSIYLSFKVVTPTYHKFLHFISDGKCKIKKETIIPDNKPYTSIHLSCNG